VQSIISFVLAIIMLTTVGSSAQPTYSPADAIVTDVRITAAPENRGFDSPEAAVAAYFAALRDADLNRMLSTFMTEKYAENYDFEAYLNRTHYYSYLTKFPNANEFVASLNLKSYEKAVTESIVTQYLLLSAFESGQDFKQSQQALMDMPNLSSLKIIGFIPLEKLSELGKSLGVPDFTDRFYDERTQSVLDEMAKLGGADRAASCIAVFEINENTYLQCMDAYEYSGKWYIAQMGGQLGRSIEAAVKLTQNLQGLLPLFHVSIYTGIDNNGIMFVKNQALSLMSKIEFIETAPVSGVSAPIIYEGEGADSPADAVKAYLEGLHDADLNRMVSAFSIESSAENYYIGVPFVNEFVTSMKIASYKERITGEIFEQYLAMCSFEYGQRIEDQKVEGEAAASKLAAQVNEMLNAPKLSTINILGFIPLEEFSDFSPFLGGLEIPDTYFDAKAKMPDADKIAGCITAFEINGNLYLLCLDAIEINGKWYIAQLGGSLSSFMYLASGWRGLAPVSAMAADIESINVNKVREMISAME
jgi:hypothetical protein